MPNYKYELPFVSHSDTFFIILPAPEWIKRVKEMIIEPVMLQISRSRKSYLPVSEVNRTYPIVIIRITSLTIMINVIFFKDIRNDFTV